MSKPAYLMALSTRPRAAIPRFFEESGPAFKLLRDPPSFRRQGFGLSVVGRPVIVDGNFWEIADHRKRVRMGSGGELLVRLPADTTFLAWSLEPARFASRPKLNPVPLVEVTASFVSLAAAFTEIFQPGQHQMEFGCAFSNARTETGKPLALTPHGVKSAAWQFEDELFSLQESDVRTKFTCSRDQLLSHPMYVAAELIKRVYLLFGIPSDKVPYVRAMNGLGVVDPKMFTEE